MALTISVVTSARRSERRRMRDSPCEMRMSRYLRTSSLLPRISNDGFPANFSVTSGMNLEVAKKFTPHLAWRLKISDKSLERQLSDALHSLSASTIMKTLEYAAATDWRTPEISSNNGRVRLSL
jgi:hypothetical protein